MTPGPLPASSRLCLTPSPATATIAKRVDERRIKTDIQGMLEETGGRHALTTSSPLMTSLYTIMVAWLGRNEKCACAGEGEEEDEKE